MTYDDEYFARSNYAHTMLAHHTVLGRVEQPLVWTLADMVALLCRPGAAVLDVGCAYGFLVAELGERGFETDGVDASPACVAGSPVADRVLLRDVAQPGSLDDLPVYDLAVAANLMEHLSPADALEMCRSVRRHARCVLAIVNKSDHDPTHVTLEPNGYWRRLFERAGWRPHSLATYAVRGRYLRSSFGTESWHSDALVFGQPTGRPRELAASALTYPALLAHRGAARVVARTRKS